MQIILLYGKICGKCWREEKRRKQQTLQELMPWDSLMLLVVKKRAISQANIQNKGNQAVSDEGFLFFWIPLEYFNLLEVSYVCQAHSALTISSTT